MKTPIRGELNRYQQAFHVFRSHPEVCFKTSCEAGHIRSPGGVRFNSVETVVRGRHIIEEEITKPLKQNNIFI